MGKPKSPTKTPNKNITLNKTINKCVDKIKKRSIQQFSKLQRKKVVEFAENNSTMTHAVIVEKFGQQQQLLFTS